MTATDALTTTAAQVEAILVDHSVTYTTTDNRGKEEDDYRVTVGDVTAYLTVSDDGDVWAITDENPADAYDGPAVADDIALHLMHYAAEIPAVVTVIDAAMNAAEGAAETIYRGDYWEVEDSHTTVEVDTDGDWRSLSLTSTGSTGAATRAVTLPPSSAPANLPMPLRLLPFRK